LAPSHAVQRRSGRFCDDGLSRCVDRQGTGPALGSATGLCPRRQGERFTGKGGPLDLIMPEGLKSAGWSWSGSADRRLTPKDSSQAGGIAMGKLRRRERGVASPIARAAP